MLAQIYVSAPLCLCPYVSVLMSNALLSAPLCPVHFCLRTYVVFVNSDSLSLQLNFLKFFPKKTLFWT